MVMISYSVHGMPSVFLQLEHERVFDGPPLEPNAQPNADTGLYSKKAPSSSDKDKAEGYQEQAKNGGLRVGGAVFGDPNDPRVRAKMSAADDDIPPVAKSISNYYSPLAKRNNMTGKYDGGRHRYRPWWLEGGGKWICCPWRWQTFGIAEGEGPDLFNKLTIEDSELQADDDGMWHEDAKVVTSTAGGDLTPVPELIGDWQFQDGTLANDPDLPAESLVDIGATCSRPLSFVNGQPYAPAESTSQKVVQFQAGTGLLLNGIGAILDTSKLSAYSIIMRVKLEDTSCYRRLLNTNFGNDYGLYTCDSLKVYPEGKASTTITPNVWHDIGIVTGPSHETTLFLDKQLVKSWTMKDKNWQRGLAIHGGMLSFFNDYGRSCKNDISGDSGAGEATSGYVARIRLWKGSLPDLEVPDLMQSESITKKREIEAESDLPEPDDEVDPIPIHTMTPPQPMERNFTLVEWIPGDVPDPPSSLVDPSLLDQIDMREIPKNPSSAPALQNAQMLISTTQSEKHQGATQGQHDAFLDFQASKAHGWRIGYFHGVEDAYGAYLRAYKRGYHEGFDAGLVEGSDKYHQVKQTGQSPDSDTGDDSGDSEVESIEGEPRIEEESNEEEGAVQKKSLKQSSSSSMNGDLDGQAQASIVQSQKAQKKEKQAKEEKDRTEVQEKPYSQVADERRQKAEEKEDADVEKQEQSDAESFELRPVETSEEKKKRRNNNKRSQSEKPGVTIEGDSSSSSTMTTEEKEAKEEDMYVGGRE